MDCFGATRLAKTSGAANSALDPAVFASAPGREAIHASVHCMDCFGATRLEMTSGAAGSAFASAPVRVLLVPDIKFFISRFLLIPPDNSLNPVSKQNQTMFDHPAGHGLNSGVITVLTLHSSLLTNYGITAWKISLQSPFRTVPFSQRTNLIISATPTIHEQMFFLIFILHKL
jgi:hypothetical protein